jgi:hypothetical protein
MYQLNTYVFEVKQILPSYKTDNAWFKWWNADDTINVLNGWRMYRQASMNALGFLLLGDTGIRTNKELLLNFGLTSAHGVQEQKDIDLINSIMNDRRRIGISAGPRARVVDVLGPGSILSDKNWSPLLNDSFILGGVRRFQDFHLADEAFDAFVPPAPVPQAHAQKMQAGLGMVRAMFGTASNAYRDPSREKWKAFFRANPQTFFKDGVPRVFAREVIGLMMFGYEPVFSNYELGFVCADRVKAANATFTSYCAALRSLSFGQNDRVKIMGAISEYLFGARDALL